MARIAGSLLALFLVYNCGITTAVPGKSGYASFNGDFFAGLFGNAGGYARGQRDHHHLEDDVHVSHKNVAVVADHTGGFGGGFNAFFNKNINIPVPEVKYKTHSIDIPVPVVQFRKVKKVIKVPDYSDEVKYRTHYVKVKTPIKVEEKVIEVPHKRTGFVATFQKNVNIRAPEVKHKIHYVKVESPVKEVDVKVVKDATHSFTGGFAAGFGKNVGVQLPDTHHKVEQVKVDVPVKYDEEENQVDFVPIHKTGVVASGFIGARIGAPLVKVDVEKKIESEYKADTDKHVAYVKKDVVIAPVQVDVRKTTGHKSVSVDAPLTSVDVHKSISGSVGVAVDAPFTKVYTSNHGGRKAVSVNAPFTNVHTVEAGLQKEVRVNAPFVDVRTGHKGTIVRAPFVDVITGPRHVYGSKSVQIRLPFFSLNLG